MMNGVRGDGEVDGLVWGDWWWNLQGWRSDKAAPPRILPALHLTLCHFLGRSKGRIDLNCFHFPSLPASSHFAHTSRLCCRTYEPLSVCECVFFFKQVFLRGGISLCSVWLALHELNILSAHKHLNSSLLKHIHHHQCEQTRAHTRWSPTSKNTQVTKPDASLGCLLLSQGWKKNPLKIEHFFCTQTQMLPKLSQPLHTSCQTKCDNKVTPHHVHTHTSDRFFSPFYFFADPSIKEDGCNV